MNANKRAVYQFLDDVGMLPEHIDLSDTVHHMLDEMSRGLSGENSSLQMIPTYIDAGAAIPQNRTVAVLDAGGTNLRAARISFSKDDKPLVQNLTKGPMPGSGGQYIGREEFFDALAAVVAPRLAGVETLGFCFSYPTRILPNIDGELIEWSKEINAPDVVGRLIGSDLKDALHNRGISDPPRIIVLNDTVATLLTGKASNIQRSWGGYVGFILGTGTNSCYLESNAKITKLSGINRQGRQVVNCESGSFAVRKRGKADLLLTEKTSNPEIYWMEKMLSGGYFGALATQSALLAGQRGVLSRQALNIFQEIGELKTRDADDYCHNPTSKEDTVMMRAIGNLSDTDDHERLWFLFDALLERAARLSAANLAASVLKGPTGSGPLSPTCLTIDGTTYYRYYRFQCRVENILQPFLNAQNKFYRTVQVDDAPLIGAAVAALSH